MSQLKVMSRTPCPKQTLMAALLPWLILLLAMFMASAHAANKTPGESQVESGRRIYEQGILISGAPLQAESFDKVQVEGARAACIQCHKRSGMGGVEGDVQIQPITAKYLFGNGEKNVATMDPKVGKRFNQRHDAYTDKILAEALRTGINNLGQKMNVLMPHFKLDKSNQQALIAYLRQLSAEASPGVTEEEIHFATVIAPGVEPERLKALRDIVSQIVTQKNGSTVVGTKRGGRRHMVTAAEMILGTERHWRVHEWELQGAPETWGAQLHEFYQRQPVFALVSGVSNSTWEPVDRFCQAEKVPCWFPSIPLPVKAEGPYGLYFSRGVALEADSLAHHLMAKKPHRLIQIIRGDEASRGGALVLKGKLAAAGVPVEDRVLAEITQESVQQALQGTGQEDVLMFWLRAADLPALEKLAPPQVATVYFSGVLAGGEKGPLPAAWKSVARLVYPYDLPEKRQLSLRYFNSWMGMHKLAIVDEPLQAEVFFSLNFLTDTVAEMLDNLHRDYLVERAENMLSRSEGAKSEQRTRELGMLGKEEEYLHKRYPRAKPVEGHDSLAGLIGATGSKSTTIYPRMGMGVAQHFASKGAYIVRFGEGGKLLTESDWIVP